MQSSQNVNVCGGGGERKLPPRGPLLLRVGQTVRTRRTQEAWKKPLGVVRVGKISCTFHFPHRPRPNLPQQEATPFGGYFPEGPARLCPAPVGAIPGSSWR